MKINMPVTNNEIILKKGTILVSRTDLMGRITYVNDAFVETSGFTRDELMGAEHNIVRHPDMPAAAYEDLWITLKKLRPWQGVVKNRCKNGDHYWVEANAMPIFKNGKVHEYLSVRHPPKRDLIPATELLYKKINAGEAKVRPSGLAAMLKSISEIAIWKKNTFVMTAFLAPIFFLMYRLFLAEEYALLTGVSLLTMMASALSINMTKVISQTLETAVTVCYRLSGGVFANKVDLNREDQLGDFLRGLYCIEVKLGLDLADFKQGLAESKRITQALDNVQSPVMVANKNFEIIYMNDSVKKLFKAAESDIRKQIPHFVADNLMGSNVDLYHPTIKTGVLEKSQESVRSQLIIGGRHMNIIASPVNGENSERIGYVAEWQDRTHEVLI